MVTRRARAVYTTASARGFSMPAASNTDALDASLQQHQAELHPTAGAGVNDTLVA